ncbi:hypothetical protein MFIFM68171_10592 [Madurella fahalii]|uniref:Uncharacterized protein n=1 Tax=Madurella fahalii TaxID=1157608 RepID=A0ABQ0GRP3_9PEZI
MDPKEVTGWTDDEILSEVRDAIGKGLTQEEKLKLEFRIDAEVKDHIAVVIDFDGSDSMVIVDGKWLATGNDPAHHGSRLYLTKDASILGIGESPVRFIHQG